MSVLGLESGYTMKHGLSPREFPRAAPSTAVGEGGAGGPGAHLRQALVCLVDLNT
jgi:hypothetical protein